MGLMKGFLENVADEMGESDITQPRVVDEAERRLAIEKRRDRRLVTAKCRGTDTFVAPDGT
ncbi:hypothetical protein LCGC14_2880070 [marine sediment metagenome]|uniref:Uncharacterized protein n=1 Tax=marine sediment metagenome TaxID=412755 RepID=A0A0F8Y0K5_9ZZZZ